MKVITNNEIIFLGEGQEFSNADAETIAANKAKLAEAKVKEKKAGYFSKERKADRKNARVEAKIERIENRTERKLARIAKLGARPLHATIVGGVKKFKDKLPKVRMSANGHGYEKVKDDGTVEPVSASNVAQLDPKKFPGLKLGPDGKLLFDKLDLAGKVPTAGMENGVAKVMTLFNENETTPVTNDNGEVQVYKKEDVVDAGKEGMSTMMKVGIGVGVLALIGGIIYLIKKTPKTS